MGDRGGGREPKGASLKKSKKNPGSTAAKQKKVSLKSQGIHQGPLTSLPPPVLQCAKDVNKIHFDCGVALLSRQFDRDRDRVVQRALEEGQCVGCLAWFSDVEKQSMLIDYCKTQTGICYCAIGVHPDNIDRTNKKLHGDWLEKIEELGRKSECVALLSGLNLSREMGTHFSQEVMMKSICQIASKIKLPVMVHLADAKSLERFLDLLATEIMDQHPDVVFILHDIIAITGGDHDILSNLLSKKDHLYFSISAAKITDSSTLSENESIQVFHHFFSSLPLDRLLLCSDSPWKTPQNLADTYLRTLRNEPSNVIGIAQALSEILRKPYQEMASILKENALRVLGLDFIELAKQLPSKLENIQLDENEETSNDEVGEKANDSDIEHTTAANTLPSSDQKKDEETTCEVSDSQTNPTNTTLKGSIQYKCVKCRTLVFSQDDIRTHDISATKTVFKVGQEGLCSSFLFIDASDGRELIHTKMGVSIRGSSIECSQCGYKLGKYSPTEGICACGAIVKGAVGKINASKVDYFDPTLILQEENIKELAEKAKLEVDAMDDDENDENEKKQGRVKKTKKHKSENRGNFSSFRNKTFVPNASRNKKKPNDDSDEDGDD